MTQENRRVHPRIHFSVENNICALLERSSPDQEESMLVQVLLLSLSEGGISFIGKSPALINLQTGDHVQLVRITEPESLQFIQRISLEVRHAVYQEDTEHILAGCRFVDIHPDQQKRIARHVRDQL